MSGAVPALAASVYFLSAPSNGTRSVLTVMPGWSVLPGHDLLLELDVLDVALGIPDGDLAQCRRGHRCRWTEPRWRRYLEPRWAPPLTGPCWPCPWSRPRPRWPLLPRGRRVEGVGSSVVLISSLVRPDVPVGLVRSGFLRRSGPAMRRGTRHRGRREVRPSLGTVRRADRTGLGSSPRGPQCCTPATSSHRSGTGPVEPRTMRRVSSRRCSGLARSRRSTTVRSRRTASSPLRRIG